MLFDQVLNMSLYMTITYVFFLICTLFLVWCNQSIDTVRLRPHRRGTTDEVQQKYLPKEELLQVCLSMCDLFVTTRHKGLKNCCNAWVYRGRVVSQFCYVTLGRKWLLQTGEWRGLKNIKPLKNKNLGLPNFYKRFFC